MHMKTTAFDVIAQPLYILTKIISKITYLKYNLNLPEAKDLTGKK